MNSTAKIHWLGQILNHVFLRFILVGVLNTLIGYTFYLLFLLIIPYNFAYTLSYILSILSSYLFNLFFVFKEKHSLKKGLQFPFIYLFQFIFSLTALNFLISMLHMNQKIAPLLIIIISTPMTYWLMRIILT